MVGRTGETKGRLSAQTPGSWSAANPFPGGTQIVDTNNNIEIAKLAWRHVRWDTTHMAVD